MFGQKNFDQNNFWVKIRLPQYKCRFIKIKSTKKLGSKSMVKKRLLTEEILLTWPNIARTYVASTKFIMTVVLRNLPLEFGQNQAGYTAIDIFQT